MAKVKGISQWADLSKTVGSCLIKGPNGIGVSPEPTLVSGTRGLSVDRIVDLESHGS